MKKLLCFVLVTAGLLSCKSNSEKKSESTYEVVTLDRQSIKKIDVHAHYQYPREHLLDLFKEWNLQAVLVDVAIADSVGINRSWDEYVAHSQAHPDLFFLCSSLIGNGIDEPDFAERAVEKLGHEIDAGAKMVKVWKNFGMVTKDASGKFIQIDDPRLQPIWDFLKDREIPVMAHIGEPIQAWRPLDDPTNPHYGYYTEHPQYHAYKIPEIPSYETIIAARDKWLENNPDLKILCAHLGSMSHNVDMVAERLDKFPNMYVEPGARFGDLAKQDSKKVKAFFEKYQDRIMFGSDFGNSGLQDTKTNTDLDEEYQELNESYERLWKFLSSNDSLVIRQQKTRGLGLPQNTLHKVYYQNTADFLKLK